MRTIGFIAIFYLLTSVGCRESQGTIPIAEDNDGRKEEILSSGESAIITGNEALLLTWFRSLPALRKVVQIRYREDLPVPPFGIRRKSQVRLTYRSRGREATSILKSGISQSDFLLAGKGNFWDKAWLGLRCPFAVMNRGDLERVENLGRRKPLVFGKGDVAFYDLAETMVFNISEDDVMFMPSEDLSEKGYLNTFNHITAQAFMTSVFSEKLADFVADVHELYNMPELITGQFTEVQLTDLENGPVDNYVDMINNEWGQELGKRLRQKHHISRLTYWSPGLLANYLNDIQKYHSWAFQIAFKPFSPTDEIVIRFAEKINKVKGM